VTEFGTHGPRSTMPVDEPFLGRTIAYRTGDGEDDWTSAVVTGVRSSSTCSLFVFQDQSTHDFVVHGNEPGMWLTLDEYEGWKIWRPEREALKRQGGGE
jgi:hypothetical protein